MNPAAFFCSSLLFFRSGARFLSLSISVTTSGSSSVISLTTWGQGYRIGEEMEIGNRGTSQLPRSFSP